MSEKTLSDSTARAGKRAWRAPVLVEYGALRTLTQTGPTAMQSESDDGSMSNMNCVPEYKFHNNCSEPAAKQNIVRIGTHPLEIGLYLFDYKPEFRDTWGHGRQFGVMADEVEQVMPSAVSRHADGYRTVDYAMLGMVTHTARKFH